LIVERKEWIDNEGKGESITGKRDGSIIEGSGLITGKIGSIMGKRLDQ
jgi:hypothetical protein